MLRSSTQFSPVGKSEAFRRWGRLSAILATLAASVPHLAAQTTVYWDIDGTTAGAGGSTPSGTWTTTGTGKNWGNIGGTVKGAAWNNGDIAVFSAGTDAIGSYTVTIGSSVTAAGVFIEEGNPIIAGGTLSVTGNFDVASGRTATLSNTSTTIGGDITGSGVLVKSGTGTLTLGPSVNFGGSLELAAGTLALSGSIAVSTLHITGNSIIDFGTGTTTLSVGSLVIDSGATLTITNWTDLVDYFYATTFTGATTDSRGTGTAAQVVFSGISSSGTLWKSFDKQITPVPEPSTYGALFLMISAGGYLWHRRSKKVRVSQRA